MKQIFSALTVIIMIISSKNSGAQTNEVAFNNPTSIVDLPAKSTDKKMFETKVTHEKVPQVNIKAVRHFTRSHKNISDARWFRTEDGYIANFLSKAIDTRIVYNDKGRWLYNLLVYSEDKLPFNIRDRVKSQYYDDDIIEVYQYELNNKTVYIIRLKDQQSNIKTLKVSDSEMEDITQHKKG